MRVVRIQGCLPTLLVLLVLAGLVALAFAAGTVVFAAGAALALAGAAVRWLWRLGRPGGSSRRPRPPGGAARDQLIEVELEGRREAPGRLPPPPERPAPE